MRNFNDKDLWVLLRLVPLVFLSYLQFLSWEEGDIWAITQWFSIILATISLIIFLMDLKGIINIRYGIPMLLMTWSIAGLFAYHITRVTLEVVKLII
tara:strand:+ start:212 stop:502 length:291 start_codon:yes stop_codon:yes gene_type:complete